VNAVACSLGVAGTGREPLRMSLRVGGQYSSTRAELVAIAAALRMTHTHPAVAFLVDSSAALQRMTWFRSKDFRPSTLSPTDPVPRGLLTLCPGASSDPQGLYTAYMQPIYSL